jgi:glucose/arabinose dehydrogenase
MDYHPDTGELWAAENGPQGGDEVNIIRPGANYGWPYVSYSRQYRGDWVSENERQSEFEQPEIIWWPSIAPAGMAFYRGDKIPEWQGNLFVGAMIEGRNTLALGTLNVLFSIAAAMKYVARVCCGS